jgi:hypothetical protein
MDVKSFNAMLYVVELKIQETEDPDELQMLRDSYQLLLQERDNLLAIMN